MVTYVRHPAAANLLQVPFAASTPATEPKKAHAHAVWACWEGFTIMEYVIQAPPSEKKQTDEVENEKLHSFANCSFMQTC